MAKIINGIFFIVILCMMILFSVVILAENQQPMQTFNKIYLNPFYRTSLSANTNYTYLLKINPPDKISSVVNAIVSFNAQVNGQTQTFTLFVNGNSCNNPTYSVATAFSTTGNLQMYFDCSNTITKAGNYTITLSSAVNTGTLQGWVDLTYMSNPKGGISIYGTEYYENDDATLFLKLKDNQGIPISNATCHVSIWYPNIAYTVHPYFVQNAMMLELDSLGIYYYDFITPVLSGLYMADATCTYSTQHYKFYEENSILVPNRTVITGTYTGNSLVLNSISDWLYTQCDSSGGVTKSCDSYYEWDLGTSPNITAMYVNYLGESTIGATMTFYYYKWSNNTWMPLPNTLLFHSTASSSVPSGVDEFQSNQIINYQDSINSTNNKVRIRTTTTAGSTFKLFSNYLVIDTSRVIGYAEDLKGSAEVHISSYTPESLSGRFYKIDTCNGYIDGRCGVFAPDTTYNLVEGVIEDYVNITAISTRDTQLKYQSPFSVDCTALYYIKEWNGTDWVELEKDTDYNVYSQTQQENCLVTINTHFQSGNTYSYEFEWDNYMKWEVLFTKQVFDTIYPEFINYCANRNFTYNVPIDIYTNLSSNPVTDFCHKTYDDAYWITTYYNDSLSVDVVGEYASYLQEMRFYRKELYNRYNFLALNRNTTLLPDNVWKYPVRNLTQYPTLLSNITVDTSQIATAVWNVSVRNLTEYPAQVDMTNYTKINQSTTYAINTSIPNFWQYTGAIADNILSNIAGRVWNWTFGRYTNGEVQ